MKDEEYELVPVNPIKKLKKRVEELEEEKQVQIPMKELSENIERLNEQVLKLVTVNINLQAKITELLIKNTEQIEQVTEMIELLKKASEVEMAESKEGAKIDLTPVVSELKVLTSQNEVIRNDFKKLGDFMRVLYRRGMLTQVAQTPTEEAVK